MLRSAAWRQPATHRSCSSRPRTARVWSWLGRAGWGPSPGCSWEPSRKRSPPMPTDPWWLSVRKPQQRCPARWSWELTRPIRLSKRCVMRSRRPVAVVLAWSLSRRWQFRTALWFDLAAAQILDRAEQDQQRLAELVTRLASEYDVPAEVRHMGGHPVDALLAVAGAESLIVVGSRGRAGLLEVVLGSVTTAVISRAVAVTVVRVPPPSPATK